MTLNVGLAFTLYNSILANNRGKHGVAHLLWRHIPAEVEMLHGYVKFPVSAMLSLKTLHDLFIICVLYILPGCSEEDISQLWHQSNRRPWCYGTCWTTTPWFVSHILISTRKLCVRKDNNLILNTWIARTARSTEVWQWKHTK